MFKKKGIYIVAIILATAVLIANIAIYILTPDLSSVGGFSGGSRPDMSSWNTSESSAATAESGEATDENSSATTNGDGSFTPPSGSDGSSFTPPSGSDGSFTPPSGSDGSSFTPPSGSDGSSFTPPSGSDGSSFTPPSGSDGSSFTPPSGTDGSFTMPGGSSTSSVTGVIGVLMKIKKFFWPITIICVLIDLISVIRLFMIRRKSKSDEADSEEEEDTKSVEPEQPEDPLIARKRKARKTIRNMLIIFLAIVILVVSIPNFFSQGDTSSAQVEEKVLTETVAKGSIKTTLAGSGTLAADNAEEMTVPGDVEIESYLVNNGDSVKEGDVLATVNTTSVMLSIAKLQSLLEALDDEIENCEDQSAGTKIKASADGRVVAIYAKKKEAVLDTMYDHDALMLISLDGYFKVTIESEEEVSIGDKVKVTLPSGKTVTGKISAALDGKITVLVSDEYGYYGKKVTVSTTDGKELGKAKLRINSELKVTGFLGTTSAIKVSVGDKVEEGDVLLKLKDTDYTATKDALYAQRSKLQDQMAELFQIYQTGTIVAPSDGIVSDIDKSLIVEESEATTEATTEASTEAATEASAEETSESSGTASGVSSIKKSYTVTGMSTTKRYTASNMTTTKRYTATTMTGSKTYTAANMSDKPESADGYSNVAGKVTAVSYSKLTVLTDNKALSISDYSDLSGIDTNSFTEKVTYTPDSSATVFIYDKASGWTVGSLSDIEKGDTLVFTYDDATNELQWIVCEHATVEETPEETKPEESKTEESKQEESKPEESQSSGDKPSGQNPSSDTPGGQQPSGDNGQSGQSGEMPSGNSGQMPSSNSGQMPSGTGSGQMPSGTGTGQSGMPSGSYTMDGTGTGTGTTEQTTEDTTEEILNEGIGETTVCTVTPQEQMVISVTIDELDILSVSNGMNVTIILDALKGQSFEGTITKVNRNGSDNGGNTKYTVEVTLDRTSDMLEGMNASVEISMGETTDVLTIPEAALVEQDGLTYVYTTYDEKNDELGGLVEVETGISDGTNVEITEGLKEGDTYIYKYADSISYTFSR